MYSFLNCRCMFPDVLEAADAHESVVSCGVWHGLEVCVYLGGSFGCQNDADVFTSSSELCSTQPDNALAMELGYMRR